MGKESVSRRAFLPALALASGLVLSACATTDEGEMETGLNPDQPPAPVEEDTLSRHPYVPVEECPADAFQVLVGQRMVEVDQATLPNPNRVIGPGDAVTMDYRPDRLNVSYDEDGVVDEVRCG